MNASISRTNVLNGESIKNNNATNKTKMPVYNNKPTFLFSRRTIFILH